MMEISVTFEDGATERFPAGTTAGEAVAAHARNGGGDRKAVARAIAARVEGSATAVVALARPLAADCRLAPVAPESSEGLEVLRHSSAHLMAQAVKRLFPETEITIGPVIENGFYYDFKRPGGFAAEDLPRIEETMRAIAKEDLPVRREEVRQRDHGRLGQALDLFSLHPIAPGSPFFHPKGAVVYNLLVEFIRSLYARYGYTEVITPLIYKTELWKTSGHYDAFRDDMFLMTIEEEEYGVKPMNCPGHCYLFATRKHSYRDLPIRYADFSRLHRFEPSGTLAGLTRVRSMAQDDAHIYCTPEQLDGELEQFIAMTREVYSAFGFEQIEVTLQTRPEKFLGRLELWDAAEDALRRALERAGFAVTVLAGQGAFYGPKIGFDFRDVLERSWTLATVQIDCAMPERFTLTYVTAEGTEATPVMLHRAVLGSLERFIAILLEHTAGRLPLWLAPVQVRVLPVSEKAAEYATRVAAACRAAGLRAG